MRLILGSPGGGMSLNQTIYMTICPLHVTCALDGLELEVFITIRLVGVLCKSIFISSFTVSPTSGPSWRDSARLAVRRNADRADIST